MIIRRYRAGSAGRGLNNIPLVFQVRVPLLRRHLVGFVWSVLNLIFQQATVGGVGNLSKRSSEICSRC